MTTLEHYAEINPPTSERAGELVAFVPMAAVSEEGRLESQESRPTVDVAKGYTAFARGDVLLAKITPCMENGKAALVSNLSTPVGFGSTEFHVLRARTGVDARFLFYLIWNRRFREEAAKHMTGSAGQKRVPTSYLKQARVPLVDSDQQRRIADILDKADAIRRKRREAISLTEELLRSAFLEMFGDPVTNPMGWTESTLGTESIEMRYGTSEKSDATEHGGQPVLRIPNVIGGEIDWTDLKYAELDADEALRLQLQQGDLLFVRSNGNPAFIGRCAVYDSTRYALFASYLIRVRVNLENVEPAYVQAALSTVSYRETLAREARTTAGNYNISTEGLRRLRLPRPPLPRQRQFLAIAQRIRSSRSSLAASLSSADALFDSLLNRAFSGALGNQ